MHTATLLLLLGFFGAASTRDEAALETAVPRLQSKFKAGACAMQCIAEDASASPPAESSEIQAAVCKPIITTYNCSRKCEQDTRNSPLSQLASDCKEKPEVISEIIECQQSTRPDLATECGESVFQNWVQSMSKFSMLQAQAALDKQLVTSKRLEATAGSYCVYTDEMQECLSRAYASCSDSAQTYIKLTLTPGSVVLKAEDLALLSDNCTRFQDGSSESLSADSSGGGSTMSKGAIAGICIACLIIVCVIAVIFVAIRRNKGHSFGLFSNPL